MKTSAGLRDYGQGQPGGGSGIFEATAYQGAPLFERKTSFFRGYARARTREAA